MCARDRSETNSSGQSKSNEILYSLINSSSVPTCVRDSGGNFVVYNSAFYELISPYALNASEWFSLISTNHQAKICMCEIRSYAGNSATLFINNSPVINGFDQITFEKIDIDCTCYIVWKLFYSYGKLPSYGRFSFLLNFNNRDVCVFSLFFSGFSHDFISKRMNISIRTSKSIIKKVYDILDLNNKDDVISVIYMEDIFRMVNNNTSILVCK